MKPFTFFLSFCFLFLQQVKSQDSLKLQMNGLPVYYKAKLDFIQGHSMSGHLLDIKDSSVFISQENKAARKKALGPDPFHKSVFTGDTAADKKYYTINSYNYKLIESIKVTNPKTKTWIIVGGAVVGATIGAIIGIKNGNDPGSPGLSAGAKGLFVGILGGGIGALTGLAVANLCEKKYLINGDWRSLEEMKASLK